ncbi:histone deacetylase [Nocardioides coralli]|uniref:histone deacetylase n=1 Tax=Nocardioides coralli TaxID=2872154 RepID=UPI001CA40E38|nr:histone deacetylase [Nocardioides coralli]QZY28222.1 histone deacetylase [Nocardioides coralli]
MTLLWYAAYGSNLDADRFAFYLTGGRPPGARRTVPGARDASPPQEDRPVVLPGSMFFAWRSPTWGGGISFYDADAPGSTYARAYLLTEQQFADVAAQEMHREPGEDLDLAHVMAHRRHAMGPGRYETLHLVGILDDIPMLTFTAEHPAQLEPTPPTDPYLTVVARGLRDCHGLDEEAVVEHLASRRGVDGDRERVSRAVRSALA